MKKFLGLFLFLFFYCIANAQYYTPIHNAQAPDYIAVIKHLGIPYGAAPVLNTNRTLPGAIFFNTTDTSLYTWTGTTWIKLGNDSSTIINNFINGFDCYPKLITGSVHIDSLFVGYTTDLYYSFNCKLYYLPAIPSFPITVSDGANDRYTHAIVDTLGNFFTKDCEYLNPVPICGVDDPGSQLIVATWFIPANSTTPLDISNIPIYKEATEWTLNRGTISSGFDSAYTVNPFAGLVSIRVPQVINGQSFNIIDSVGIYDRSRYTHLTFQLRLGAVFNNTTRLNADFWLNNSLVTSNTIPIAHNNYGFDRTVSGSYQFISIPLGDWNFFSANLNKVRFTLSGANASGFQIDNVLLVKDAGTVNTVQSVQSVNGMFDTHINLLLIDTARLNADSTEYVYTDKRTGTTMAVTPTLLTYLTSIDTCLIITRVGTTKYWNGSINPNCLGGGSTDTTSLSNRIDAKLNISDTAAMLSPKVDKTTTITINGVEQDLSANRSWTVTGGNDTAYVAMGTATDSSYVLLFHSDRSIAPDTLRAFGGIDTTNKWVNNVTKLNDSTIRVFKGDGYTDLEINGNGAGGGGGANQWTVGTFNPDNIHRPTGNVGIGDTAKAKLTVTVNNVGVLGQGADATDSSGIMLVNNTPAASGLQQNSPTLIFSGNGWKTNATAASVRTRFRMFVRPNQGTTTSYSDLIISPQSGAAAWSDAWIFSQSTGIFNSVFGISSTQGGASFAGAISGTAASLNAASTITIAGMGAVSANGLSMVPAVATVGAPVRYSPAFRFSGNAWNTTTLTGQYSDFRIDNRPVSGDPISGAMVWSHGINGAAFSDAMTLNSNGRLILTNTATLKGYTVATLPAGNIGDIAYVTDATAPTYLGALTGGGAIVCPVFFDGTIWVSH